MTILIGTFAAGLSVLFAGLAIRVFEFLVDTSDRTDRR